MKQRNKALYSLNAGSSHSSGNHSEGATAPGLPVFNTPKKLGYYFPAEFAPHCATWLSWPHKEASWPGKLN
ncbi:MAG TPA: hypothetical protein VFV68_09350, partial [Agriterribacter sp.]|nr:hypothetical protein [Agriterribacter sp.]